MTDHTLSKAKTNEKYLNFKPSLGDKMHGIAMGAFTFAAIAVPCIASMLYLNIPIAEAGLLLGGYAGYEKGKQTMKKSALKNDRVELKNSMGPPLF